MAKVEIKQDGCITHIILDGKDISHMVRAFSFGQDVGKAEDCPILRLDIVATDLTVDSTCFPALPEIFKPYYVEKKKAAPDGTEADGTNE